MIAIFDSFEDAELTYQFFLNWKTVLERDIILEGVEIQASYRILVGGNKMIDVIYEELLNLSLRRSR